MTIRLLLVDDHEVVLEGIRNLLADLDDIEVVGSASDGRAAVRMAEELTPDVVVMDVGLPELNGMEATRRITSRVPGIGVIALSMRINARFVTEMLGAGVTTYLHKSCNIEELIQAIRTVAAGDARAMPVDRDDEDEDSAPPAEAESPSLSRREIEVLTSLAEGLGTREIANRFGVSISTVETHRRRIMNKLDIHSVAELTKYAIRQGLSPLER